MALADRFPTTETLHIHLRATGRGVHGYAQFNEGHPHNRASPTTSTHRSRKGYLLWLEQWQRPEWCPHGLGYRHNASALMVEGGQHDTSRVMVPIGGWELGKRIAWFAQRYTDRANTQC
jgi:hypothetical protein